MSYTYRSLPPTLHSTADAAIEWFVHKWGVARSRVEIEAEFHSDISFRPTFSALTKDHHILCVETSESIYSNTLDSVVLDCRQKGLPVLLFVAVPKGVSDAQYGKKLKDAKRAGVGILEVDQNSGTIVQNALPLSLAGVREADTADFPSRYREPLQRAYQTFISGDPAKACAIVYDELEATFRKFAKKCVAKNLWANDGNLNLDKDSWANIISEVNRCLNRSDPAAKKVTPALCSRIHGVTTHRNDTGHKPKDVKALIKRDKELRTRFESAIDLLAEFLEATASLRL